MSQPDTKVKILDAAEVLFARDGYYATSLRAITSAAGVNLAAVNYHFGSKETLLEEVIGRRLDPLNQARSSALEQVLQETPSARAVLGAFIEPTLALRRPGVGAEAFITLIGRLMADPEGIGRDIFLRRMMPLMQRFYEALCLALPGVSRDLLFWRLHFAIGSLSHLMRCHDRHQTAPDGIDPDLPVEQMIEMLLDYTLAGMEVGG